ncbi:DUF4260 domain-containing protein [Halobacillus karajensis]|uniref:DUF4260 domain-containing protein n=1 Tax=Halobacillus karajensis TaxID=195088 RepID=A0A024P193_9BACI|nr:DUF4260 domain-containing protein [Halobacillus karajensis]CDQ19365.1 hypothetical protein BN982_01658 [Halobacillus karajensis]CDQ21828.1 hypothetical protein BN983_00022 [Halobacillus karajensis]CDQ27668.1 hypothetical protein BN981_01948 [Halobacillus karajensis]
MPKLFLHLEGTVIFIASLYFYQQNNFSWLAFIFLLFVFDSSMIGYVINERVGAIVYNIFHSYILPVTLILISSFITLDWLLMVSLIWTAHIGMDRMIGYGLKYRSGFKDTHFQKV